MIQKSIFFRKFQKTVAILLLIIYAFVSLFAFMSCGNYDVSHDSSEESKNKSDFSDEYSEISSSENSFNIDGELEDFIKSAKLLLKKDNEVIRLIISGGIANDENIVTGSSVPTPLSENNKYYYFKELKKLLDECYSDGGEYILSFPFYGEKTVSDVDGITYVTNHYTSDFSDFSMPETLSLHSYDMFEAEIGVKTSNGNDAVIGLEKSNGVWKLKNSIYEVSGSSTIYDTSKKFTSKNAGSSAELKGKCLIVNLFINDKNSSWKTDAVNDVISKVDSACDFIERNAELYDTNLTFTSSTPFYMSTSDKLPTDMDNFVWIDMIFADTSYKTVEGYVKSHFDISLFDNWCLMIHINKKGRSYSVVCDKSNYDWKCYTAERCVIYHTDNKTYRYYDSVGVYVHEILHLFGAVDLYAPFVSDSADELLGKYCPNEVMRLVPGDVETSSVSHFTAYLLGWTDFLYEQFGFMIK